MTYMCDDDLYEKSLRSVMMTYMRKVLVSCRVWQSSPSPSSLPLHHHPLTLFIDNDDDDDDEDDDLYIIGAVCLYPVSCDEKVTSSLIWSATVAGEIYI